MKDILENKVNEFIQDKSISFFRIRCGKNDKVLKHYTMVTYFDEGDTSEV